MFKAAEHFATAAFDFFDGGHPQKYEKKLPSPRKNLTFRQEDKR